jgi:hypothetical protein
MIKEFVAMRSERLLLTKTADPNEQSRNHGAGKAHQFPESCDGFGWHETWNHDLFLEPFVEFVVDIKTSVSAIANPKAGDR